MSAIPEPSYVVVNENTLGYIQPERPSWFNVLHGSVFKGGRNWKNGAVPLSPNDQVRPATLEDFDEYRVISPPGFGEGNARDRSTGDEPDGPGM